MKVIEAKGLTKYYGKARGIVGVGLSVEEGEFFGFIGPNGAGKSTTIRTLLGLLPVAGGSASVLGYDVGEKSRAYLKEVGYMPGEASFYGNMRVREVIALSAELHKKDCREEAGELCERLKLDTAKKIEELSLGNKKKTAIVCAMQHKPRLYIFDVNCRIA